MLTCLHEQVEYPAYPSYPGSCSGQRAKMSTVANGIRKVCDRSKANCDLGLAVHGFSQGAHIASLAKEYEPRVSAALHFGHGNTNLGSLLGALASFGMSGSTGVMNCFNNANNRLPRSKRRYLNGENDPFFGVIASGNRRQLQAVSGYNCGNRNDCIQSDGSGYKIVTASNLGINIVAAMLGQPGHCFFLSTCITGGLRGSWRNAGASSKYGMVHSFNWLAHAARGTIAPQPLPMCDQQALSRSASARLFACTCLHARMFACS